MRGPSALGAIVLFALAAGYYALGIQLPIGWFDEGMIVYPSWRVTQGEIPYREFRQLYGPSLFFLNGALFRWLGEDLLAVRASMVVIKAVIALLVYAVTCRVAPRAFAALAFGVTVAVWGLPIPAAVISYANYHAMSLVFAGLLILLALPARLRLACFAAGLCFGLAATFKQTSGAFAFTAVCLFLLVQRAGSTAGAATESGPAPLPPALVATARAARAFVLVFALALFGYYLLRANTALNLAVMLPPVLLLAGRLGWDDWRGRVAAARQVESLRALLALAAGAALPLVGYLLYYASQGLVDELLFNMVTHVPQAHRWLVTYPPSSDTWPLWAGAWGGAVACLWLWSPAQRDASPQYAPARWAALLGFGACTGWLLQRQLADAITGSWSFWSPADLWHQKWWFWSSSDLLELIPPACSWGAALWLVRRGTAAREGAPDTERGVALLGCFAIVSSLTLYPCADVIHAFMAVPAFLPLIAYHAHTLHAHSTGRVRVAAAAYAGVLACALAVPAVADLAGEASRQRANEHGFPRASGIAGGNEISRDAAKLIAWLDQPEQRESGILVLTGRQLLYFLSGRTSPVQRSQFGLYLVSIDTITDEGVRELVDEPDLVRVLERERPIVIDDVYNAAGRNVYLRLPAVARALRREYRQVAMFGKFRVYLPGAR